MDQAVRATVQQLLKKVPDAATRAQLADLIRLSLGALDGLLSLDDSVYTYFSDTTLQGELPSVDPEEPSFREALLRDIRGKTFSGMRKFSKLLGTSKLLRLDEEASSSNSVRPPESSIDLGDDWDFDIGPSIPPPKSLQRLALPTLNELDIEKAFGFVTREDEGGADRLAEYREAASTTAHVLCKEFRDAEARIDAAFERNQHDVVLRELDTSRESLTEGVFALLLLTFRHFLGDEGRLERSVLLPGYKNSLERSLTIRRGLVDLRRIVTAENDWVIQDSSLARKVHYESITNLAEQLKVFTDSEAFRFMRAPDRIEMKRFLSTISMGSYREASQACEGLSRYLESLSVINQREVLQQHDQDVILDIDTSLDAARSILTVSPSGSRAMVRQALTQAERLYGRNTAFDDRVSGWMDDLSVLDTSEGLESVINTLHELLH
jgi:hypothetical protein